MDEHPLIVSITELSDTITNLPALHDHTPEESEDRKKIINELNNHLVNIRREVRESIDSFNGTEQFLILKDAQKELNEFNSRLFDAHQINMISDEQYQHIAEKIRNFEDQISDTVDPEYV